MQDLLCGFILSRHWRDTSHGILIELWLATDQGPIKLLIPSQKAIFFVRQQDVERIQGLLSPYSHIVIKTRDLKNFHNEPVAAVYCSQQRQLRQLCDSLDVQGIPLWEAEIRMTERFLMERFITSNAAFPHSFLVRHSPHFQQAQLTTIKPCDYQPQLFMVSFDLETYMDAKALYSIAVYSSEHACVFMVGNPLSDSNTVDVVWCNDAKACLQQFFSWLEKEDPDVLIGWHVIQFDCWVLKNLCERYDIPFALGRDRQVPHWREDGSRYYIKVHGRVVLDGIELLRTAFYYFDSFRLEFVAQQLLG